MDLGTQRLRLRPVTSGDAHLLQRLDADPEVMRFVSGGRPTPSATITDWVIPRSQAQFRSTGTGLWLAHDLTEHRFQGWVWLRLPRHSEATEFELSYRFRRQAWGRGLATEAADALIGSAFTTTWVTRIFASTHPDNIGSQRVMAKLGMRPAASGFAPSQLSPERFDDGNGGADVEFELLRADWERTRPGAARHARRGGAHRAPPSGTAGMLA